MAIGEYSSNIDKITDDAKNHKKDLKLTKEASDLWVSALLNHYVKTVKFYGETHGMDHIGNCGNFQSADDIKNNLIVAISGHGGLQATLQAHVDYQASLVKAVRTAHDIVFKHG